jgi:PAS domain S-box-containing protein
MRRIVVSIVERIQLQADIISNINDCVIVADPDLQIILWNRVAEKIFGHREEEVLGKKVKEVFGGLEYKQNPSFCRALDEKREWQGEVVIAASPVRGEKNLRVSISIIRDVAGEIKYMASIITDISELVQSRQEAREASQAKSDFLANMSHELRTPLVGIMGYCELLSQDRLSFHQREYVVTIQHCADQLLNLVNNILDLSKIENKQVEVNPRPFFLAELIRQAINALKPDADKKGLDINLIIAPGIPDIIIADGILIRRILNNLLINAVKFTSQGDIRIKADRKMEIPATGGSEFVLAISVEDAE